VIIASDQLGAVGGLQATYQQAVARLNQARVNLQRTEIRSPVNGYVTNLLVQLGDYATVGTNIISLVDADSYWVDGYFEETNLEPIRVGDAATIKLKADTERPYDSARRGRYRPLRRRQATV
jgi:multidrug resistance efflux pump